MKVKRKEGVNCLTMPKRNAAHKCLKFPLMMTFRAGGSIGLGPLPSILQLLCNVFRKLFPIRRSWPPHQNGSCFSCLVVFGKDIACGTKNSWVRVGGRVMRVLTIHPNKFLGSLDCPILSLTGFWAEGCQVLWKGWPTWWKHEAGWWLLLTHEKCFTWSVGHAQD